MNYYEVGKIVNTHGIKGELKINKNLKTRYVHSLF